MLLVGSPAGRDVLAKLDCSVWLAAKPQCGTERGTQTPLSASSWEAVQNSGTELSKPSQEAHREVEPFVFARSPRTASWKRGTNLEAYIWAAMASCAPFFGIDDTVPSIWRCNHQRGATSGLVDPRDQRRAPRTVLKRAIPSHITPHHLHRICLASAATLPEPSISTLSASVVSTSPRHLRPAAINIVDLGARYLPCPRQRLFCGSPACSG